MVLAQRHNPRLPFPPTRVRFAAVSFYQRPFCRCFTRFFGAGGNYAVASFASLFFGVGEKIMRWFRLRHTFSDVEEKITRRFR